MSVVCRDANSERSPPFVHLVFFHYIIVTLVFLSFHWLPLKKCVRHTRSSISASCAVSSFPADRAISLEEHLALIES